MNRTDSPTKQTKPFGVNGQREPLLPTTPAGDNTASYDLGFPPITMILKSAGGLPPKGQDMNQILFELSSLCRWSSSGAMNTFDLDFATAIGGYPAGSYVLGDNLSTIFRCTTDGNINNPNTTNTGWTMLAEDISGQIGLRTASTRDVGNGTNQIPDMSYFATAGTINGYQKLPSGLIIQWGRTAIPAGGIFVTFPIAFPTTTYVVLIGQVGSTSTIISANNYLNNGFTFQTSAATIVDQVWMAIGR